jgi:hypothetical protein
MTAKPLPLERAFRNVALATLLALVMVFLPVPREANAQAPEPFVAIHVSEHTQALESAPAVPPTPTGSDTSGYQWWYTSWHYFVAYESLKEALRSDGTPFVEISDSDIAAGKLRHPDGSPRYPILISLAAEAIADDEINPLRDYVASGGFLLAGSSAFTRNPNGTTRGDFALASEMGIHMAGATLSNWYTNAHFTKNGSHRLTSHIPSGTLLWSAPLTSDQPSWIIFPSYLFHSSHYAWQVAANDATVIASGDSGPLISVKSYGEGQFIYHGVFQPLIGHGGYDPGMYAYLIYRKAIEWAFESRALPIVRVSPWPYQYDAAFVVRHDFESDQTAIKSIEASAQFEKSLGAKGDYYFCTGALRDDMWEDPATISSLRSAVANYGATIGSHNGGLRNPSNPSLTQLDYEYWHWGPDEALDTSPPGYASGKAYASESILTSFRDIERWLAGLDNGRAGCGVTGNCPRTWVSPFFNSAREDSRDILDKLGSATMGEQKISPFPHRTLSYGTKGKYYSPITLPASDWYVGADVAQSTEYGHTLSTIDTAVDFYYNSGFLINIYGHARSDNGSAQQRYVTYGMSKPRLWATNHAGISDWWRLRSSVAVTPAFTSTGDIYTVTASVAGATDPATAVEFVIPPTYGGTVSVYLNDTPAISADYRITSNGVKVLVGSKATVVRVQNAPPPALSALALNPASVAGGTSSQGTVTLTAPAPSGGVVVTLSDNSSAATVPASVTVPAGSSSAVFTITTVKVTSTRTVRISAAYGGVTKTATLTVTPSSTPVLSTLVLAPTSVTGGAGSQGTVTLSASAPTGGAVVTLSDNSSAATVPASVTVPAGSTSATFTVGTTTVATATSVTVTAVYGGVTRTATLSVTPATVSTVSGSITPAPSGAGTTLTLSRAGSTVATVTADANGVYAFSSVADGTYTVAPTKAGFTFTPASTQVTVSGASVTGINFTAAGLSIDVTTSSDAGPLTGSTITTPAFATRAGNELLLAFIPASYPGAAPNIAVTGVSGGGLTWTLVRRTNTQQGTAEIWRAFATAPLTNATVTATLSKNGAAAAITVVAVAGVSASTPVGAVGGASAANGAPTATLTTQGANSWLFGVGNDWDGAVARTVGANQTMVHQYLSPTADTFWVQRQNATVQPAGTVVTIGDMAPTNHQWNLSIVEIRQ